ncbi:hypothetical protein LOAG_04873 [Loa loa]|uniref:Uncharacterized protein n=1 Tax=Loa loa TaxID=7209 RepID=A0A1S0U184_LOALO|nr:hypothetical protein LOAG_04873 [Loa loa]EFO23608.1 hypothetical protein LOAG_04873 [Loa loa]
MIADVLQRSDEIHRAIAVKMRKMEKSTKRNGSETKAMTNLKRESLYHSDNLVKSNQSRAMADCPILLSSLYYRILRISTVSMIHEVVKQVCLRHNRIWHDTHDADPYL